MTPETEGDDEKGPERLPYVNDPAKKPHPADGKADRDEPDSTRNRTSGDAQ